MVVDFPDACLRVHSSLHWNHVDFGRENAILTCFLSAIWFGYLLYVAFKALGKLILDVGLLLAYHCDGYGNFSSYMYIYTHDYLNELCPVGTIVLVSIQIVEYVWLTYFAQTNNNTFF